MLPLDPTQATRTHVHQAEANATPVNTMIVVDDKNTVCKNNNWARTAPAKHFALTGNSSLDAWSSKSMPGLRWNAHYEVSAPSSTESLDAEVPVHTLRLCPPASALHE